jgi:uncharacterized membrane protein YeaQ/YmgE (transglycosylase-associated protein family)
MNLLGLLFSGFIVGLIARAVMPGDQKMGLIRTTVLGVLGSFVGGILANVLAGASWSEPRATGFLGSVGGAIAVMVIARFVRGK